MQIRDIIRDDILRIVCDPVETVYDEECYKSFGIKTDSSVKEQSYLLIAYNILNSR